MGGSASPYWILTQTSALELGVQPVLVLIEWKVRGRGGQKEGEKWRVEGENGGWAETDVEVEGSEVVWPTSFADWLEGMLFLVVWW
jgi:hypothetical protein